VFAYLGTRFASADVNPVMQGEGTMITAIPRGIALLSVALLLAAGTPATIEAQRRSPTGTAPNYDVATEVTLTGAIEDVKTIPGPGLEGGVHLMLKTAKETIEIDLGPEWFLKKQNYRLSKGDDITVIGSRVRRDASEAVIARQITKGKETMTFRDEKGFPRWSGGSKRIRARSGAPAWDLSPEPSSDPAVDKAVTRSIG
jgi:hypothetical protein